MGYGMDNPMMRPVTEISYAIQSIAMAISQTIGICGVCCVTVQSLMKEVGRPLAQRAREATHKLLGELRQRRIDAERYEKINRMTEEERKMEVAARRRRATARWALAFAVTVIGAKAVRAVIGWIAYALLPRGSHGRLMDRGGMNGAVGSYIGRNEGYNRNQYGSNHAGSWGSGMGTGEYNGGGYGYGSGLSSYSQSPYNVG